MGSKKEQVLIQAGISLLVVLGLLVAWQFFLEDLILGSLLGADVSKSPLEQWAFIILSLVIACAAMALPVIKLSAAFQEIDHTRNALRGEQRMSQVFFTVDNSILILVDPAGKITQVNQKASQLLGYRENEMLGKDMATFLIPEKNRALVKKHFQELIQDPNKPIRRYTSVAIAKNRGEKYIEWQASALMDNNDEIVGVIHSGQDISEQSRLTQELKNTINRYEPQLKKMAADLAESKKKQHAEAVTSSLSRNKFQFWFDLENILLSMTDEQKANPVELDNRIKLALQRYGEMAKVDNGYIFLFDEDGSMMMNTHIWDSSNPNLAPEPEETIPLETFPWFEEKIKKLQVINVPQVAKLPKEASSEKEVFLSQNVKSLLSAPLILEGKALGSIGFESARAEKAWDKDEVKMLKVLARMLVPLVKSRVRPEIEPEPALQINTAETTVETLPLADHEQALNELRNDFEQQLKERTDELEETRAKLESELEENRTGMENLQQNQENMQQELSERSEQLEKVQAELDQELEEKQRLVESLSMTADELEGRVQKIQEKQDEVSATTLKEMQEEHKAKIAELEEQISLKEQELTKLQENIEQESSSRTELEESLEEIQEGMERKEQEFKALEVAHNMLQSELSELRQVQNDFTQAREALEQEEEIKKDLRNDLEELENEIQEHKQRASMLEEKTQRLDRLGLPIISVDAKGFILDWNKAAEWQFGFTADDVVGQPLNSLMVEADQLDFEESVINTLQEKQMHTYKLSIKTAEDKAIPVSLSLSSLIDDQGEIKGAVATVVDPVETSGEASLAAGYYKSIRDHAGLMVLNLSSNYQILDLNELTENTFGWERKTVFEQNFFELTLPEEQSEDISADVADRLSSHPSAEFECETYIGGDRKRTLFWTLTRQANEAGETLGILAIGQDLTELRQSELALKENENLLGSVVENALDGFITIDESGIVQSFNPAAESIFGYKASEMVGQNISSLMPEPYRSEHSNYINNYLVTGKAKLVGQAPREFVAQKKDGTTFPVEVAVREMYQDYRRMFIGIVHDISKRKNVEQSLKESEEKFRKVMAAESDAILILNNTTKRVLDANDSALKMFGYDREDLLRLKLSDISTEPEKSLAAGNGSVLGQISKTPLRYHKKKDGTVFPSQVSNAQFIHQNQKMTLRVIRDLTKQKRIEESLRESEDHIRTILNSTPAAVYLKDSEGRYTLVNSEFENLFRISNEQARGKLDDEIFPQDMAQEFKEHDQKVLATGSSINSQESILHNDGAHIYDSIKFPLRSSSGVLYGMCCILTDITQRVRLKEEVESIRGHLDELVEKRTEELKVIQQKVIRTEKLEATGQLASSIANQINNPVHGIRNILEQVSERVHMEEIHKGLVDVAISECSRVSELLEKLKECHAPEPSETEHLDLHELIEEAIRANEEQLDSKTITLEKHYAQNLPRVEGVGDQLKQVLQNLIQNAEESLPDDRGKILIATECDHNQIKIHIQDTGCGIPPENLNNIFDPFFTTKSAFKRTGLGLLVTLGIVKNHHGDIEVKSQPGKGTTFTILLPAGA